MKVLVSDPLSEVGVRIFENTPGIEVDVKTGLSPDALKAIIGDYHGLVIRSATRVTADLIAAARRLRVIGRAGIGLDNVDIPAASQRGIAVMNTPLGNTITTAEHTMAMLMALSRNIPQATASLKAGRWEKKKLQGRELFNKTLGLIGAGNIGRIVADRARGLKMRVVVFDPYIKPQVVEELGLTPVDLEQLLQQADYISIHTPRTEETANLINKDTLARMKPGAMLINCARGGIVNEADLYDALSSGHLGGAAMDVFAAEPPGEIPLMSLPNFICTPHLGASTREAQVNVAKDVAEQIVDYLLNGSVRNAVNMPNISAELASTLKPFAFLAEKLGSLQTQLAQSGVESVSIAYAGRIADYDVTALTAAALKGLLTPILKDDVNFINAPLIAAERGIKVVESKTSTSDNFTSLIVVKVKAGDTENIVSGTVFANSLPRLLRINDFYLETLPEGNMLLMKNDNVPGILGQIGTILGRYGINVDRMQVGHNGGNGHNLVLMATRSPIAGEVVGELRTFEGIHAVQQIAL